MRATRSIGFGGSVVVALHSVGDYVVLFVVAAECGAIGGLAAALVPTTSPGVNSPRALTGPIVGATAAIAILIVFPGTKDAVTVAAGKSVTTTSWSLLRVVPVTLIAGWAGPKVLAVLQDRVLAAGKEAQLQATATVAKAQIEKIAGTAHAAVGEASGHSLGVTSAPTLRETLDPAVEDAKAAIDAVAASAR